ncbi:MAG: hypothetical protein LBN23_00170, partial [Paludibacter sp.]|nr:hypothetical protein [Paludibacter sp.]
MKRLLFLLCFISFILNTIAENPDTVYLTNGHIIYGQIIEQSNNEYLKINTNDKGIFVFSFLDIVRINSEQIKNAVVYTQTIGLKQLEEEKNDTTTAEMAYLYDAHPAKKRRDELKLNMLSILLSGVQLEYEHFRGNGISFGTYLSYNNEDSSFGVAPYFRAYAEKRD